MFDRRAFGSRRAISFHSFSHRQPDKGPRIALLQAAVRSYAAAVRIDDPHRDAASLVKGIDALDTDFANLIVARERRIRTRLPRGAGLLLAVASCKRSFLL